MGHVQLAALPGGRQWSRVTGLLDEQAPHVLVIGAAAAAIQRDMERVLDHPGLAAAVRLLAGLPSAAQSDNYEEALRRVGLALPSAPGFISLLQSVGSAIDEQNIQTGRSDFAELVRNALVETIAASAGSSLDQPLRADADATRAALAALAGAGGFSGMAERFFARLTRDGLAYYLSRTLSARIGPNLTFATVGERDAFDGALDRHCREASGMLREFARGWYARASGEQAITPQAAQSFASVSLRRMLAELADAAPVDA